MFTIYTISLNMGILSIIVRLPFQWNANSAITLHATLSLGIPLGCFKHRIHYIIKHLQ